MRFIDRISWAYDNLEPIEPKYCIVWEDPDDPESGVNITHPAPEWMACALHGGILPPVDVYEKIQAHTMQTVNGHLLHEMPPEGPMTEAEAMEYLVQKDVPSRVWARDHNRRMFCIVPKASLPKDRTYRNAWELAA